jgi:hypothetical protein
MHKMLLQDDIILWFKSSEVSADWRLVVILLASLGS